MTGEDERQRQHQQHYMRGGPATAAAHGESAGELHTRRETWRRSLARHRWSTVAAAAAATTESISGSSGGPCGALCIL